MVTITKGVNMKHEEDKNNERKMDETAEKAKTKSP